MVTLGLDISTSCTGWCILSGFNDSLHKNVNLGFVDLSKEKNTFRKAVLVKETLSWLHIKFPIDRVVIEENLQSFRSGFSSAKTLSTLARFNGIVSYLCYEEFSITPEFINVNHARKSLGIKTKRKKDGGAPIKEQIFDWVSSSQEMTEFTWPTKTLKSGPRRGQIILDPRSYDMADAYVIAKAGQII